MATLVKLLHNGHPIGIRAEVDGFFLEMLIPCDCDGQAIGRDEDRDLWCEGFAWVPKFKDTVSGQEIPSGYYNQVRNAMMKHPLVMYYSSSDEEILEVYALLADCDSSEQVELDTLNRVLLAH